MYAIVSKPSNERSLARRSRKRNSGYFAQSTPRTQSSALCVATVLKVKRSEEKYQTNEFYV
jgi:hypothetical protein